jgi:hypothetical protein
VIVRLPVRKRNETARLAFEGDAALAQEVRRRILHYFHLTPKELSSVAGDWLRQWMASRELRELNPELIEGAPILEYGGTYSQDDCHKGASLIARWLVSLAILPRDRIWENGGTYEWEHIVEGQVMMLVHELAAWSESCRDALDQPATLDQAIRAELVANTSIEDYEPARLLAAFEKATERATAEMILCEFWRILDSSRPA